MGEIYEYIVSKEDNRSRLDTFLRDNNSIFSRSLYSRLIEEGKVLVNNKVAKKNGVKLEEGDKVTLEVEEAKPLEIKKENIPLDIVYEDEDLIIINKQKDMVVHPSNGHLSGTLVNGLMYYVEDSLSGINGVMRPGIVHRIDKDTTGLLIVCKNDNSHRIISNQLSKHSISREYEAIVHGNLKNDGTISTLIRINPKDRLKMAVVLSNGKDAITHYEVIKNYTNYTHIRLKLETGRTHQIRVHMAHIGHPLLGDSVYGRKKEKDFKNLEGQCLHAKKIGFIHPRTNEYMMFDSELPKYFKDLLDKLEKNSK